MPLGLIGKKLGQTAIYDSIGILRPVTIVLAGPNRVLQIRTEENDGYEAVQLGFGNQKTQRLSKAMLGHLAKHMALDEKVARTAQDKGDKTSLVGVAKIHEFRDFSKPVSPGELVGASLFSAGDFVDVIGITKGRGFEGVVGRHGFRGGDSTHGAKGWHRRSGAIGQRLFPGTVMRGMKMPGHLGRVRRTVQNLRIIQVRDTESLLLIQGAVPGANGDYVIIREAKKLSQQRCQQLRDITSSTSAGKKTDQQRKGPAKAAPVK